MMDKKTKQPWKNLIYGILSQAIADCKHEDLQPNAIWFARSKWCQRLCEETDIDYKAYLRKVEELCKIQK